MPSFGGLPIFGFGVVIVTGDIELRRQENTFPGINGLESLTLGSSGLYTDVDGNLSGSDASALASAEATFRSYRDGNPYTLVDSYGAAWGNVLLEAFSPQGRICQTSAGAFHRPYKARFRHLSTS